ncbi:Uncharacterised protein [Candidatus Tiddalikarchaeum anstoanum]|nr:Uncharacterised protein [Candidatus Tiddalikarchaeum anstoanum]
MAGTIIDEIKKIKISKIDAGIIQGLKRNNPSVSVLIKGASLINNHNPYVLLEFDNNGSLRGINIPGTVFCYGKESDDEIRKYEQEIYSMPSFNGTIVNVKSGSEDSIIGESVHNILLINKGKLKGTQNYSIFVEVPETIINIIRQNKDKEGKIEFDNNLASQAVREKELSDYEIKKYGGILFGITQNSTPYYSGYYPTEKEFESIYMSHMAALFNLLKNVSITLKRVFHVIFMDDKKIGLNQMVEFLEFDDYIIWINLDKNFKFNLNNINKFRLINEKIVNANVKLLVNISNSVKNVTEVEGLFTSLNIKDMNVSSLTEKDELIIKNAFDLESFMGGLTIFNEFRRDIPEKGSRYVIEVEDGSYHLLSDEIIQKAQITNVIENLKNNIIINFQSKEYYTKLIYVLEKNIKGVDYDKIAEQIINSYVFEDNELVQDKKTMYDIYLTILQILENKLSSKKLLEPEMVFSNLRQSSKVSSTAFSTDLFREFYHNLIRASTLFSKEKYNIRRAAINEYARKVNENVIELINSDFIKVLSGHETAERLIEKIKSFIDETSVDKEIMEDAKKYLSRRLIKTINVNKDNNNLINILEKIFLLLNNKELENEYKTVKNNYEKSIAGSVISILPKLAGNVTDK